MTEGYLDNCLSANEDDEDYKEKTRLAKAAADTLCRLNSIMKQMKGWRDDRVKLTSNIWRLKLALRVAGKETNDSLHGDPLIEHQRAEIKRLQADNQALKKEIADIKAAVVDTSYDEKQEYLVEQEYLNNEILYLKSRLKEAEEGHEHNSEVEHLKCKLKHFMMVDHTMEIILTDIVNKVAETVANLSEELVNMNDHLHRSKQRNDHLLTRIDQLTAILRSKSGNIVDYQKRMRELNNLTKCLKTESDKLTDNSWTVDSTRQTNLDNIERLASDLKTKLKNDYEAVLGAGDLDCLKYIQNIAELRVNLKLLHVRLRPKEDTSNCSKYLKQLSDIESTLTEINAEIEKLKEEHAKKNCRTVQFEGVKYLKKIEDLQVIIEKVRITVSELNDDGREDSKEGAEIVKLADSVGRVCQEIKQLEMIVVSNDRSVQLKRIERLEETVVELKTESNEKDERLSALSTGLFNTETAFKEAKRKVDLLTEENKALEERTSELRREQEEQLQQVKRDLNVTRKKLQNVRCEKEKLLKETEGLRDTLERRKQEINVIVAEKLSVEKALKTKVTELTRNLQAASKENERLQNKAKELERSRDPTNVSREIKNEAEILRDKLKLSKESLGTANCKILDLQTKLENLSTEKSKLETDICHLESKKDILVYELGVEKTIAEERLVKLTKLKSDYNKLDIERMNLKSEKERLNRQLIDLTGKKEQLDGECLKFQDEIDKYRSELSALQEEARGSRIGKENLSAKLEEAGHKIRRLEFENSKLRDDWNDLSLKNIRLEERVQVLLTEKNGLVTRINELDGKNVALKDQLNKVQAENEYSPVELNKLRMECDRARSANASLQNMLDESARSNRAMKETCDELKLKLNEVYSECRILENQLKILEIGGAALKKEKEALQRRINELRSNQHKECTEQNFVRKPDDETKKISKKSSKRSSDKLKSKEERKQLLVENEALKLEVFNLKEQNLRIKMEMTRMKDELQRRETGNDINESERSNKLEIVNLYYGEVDSYSGENFRNMSALACVGQGNMCPFEIQSEIEVERLLEVVNKLKIENCALKMEVNTLRCNLLVNVTEDEKRRQEVRDTREEIRALKVELAKLRDEKESLQDRLDTVRTKLDQLESEKAALKNELYALRKTNSDLVLRANELQRDYQKLKGISEGFDSYVMGAIEKIKKYTTGAGELEEMDEELKAFLEKYMSNEKFFNLINQWQINVEDT